ncbi:hypothetical protein LOK49_LG10G02084 [Camellia lanceoleosa]|uniref:Uncharacterized protein n=1 Tax=Camellia lanceoleosa TaxID=1840588 RepID=A0ACC0GEG6_9ERIC|nr:hypothetical protein LOK49_LG10G02084 [Camellia lanceoleosa]
MTPAAIVVATVLPPQPLSPCNFLYHCLALPTATTNHCHHYSPKPATLITISDHCDSSPSPPPTPIPTISTTFLCYESLPLTSATTNNPSPSPSPSPSSSFQI